MYLDFLNKNMYRNYPLKASSSGMSIDSELLPDTIITSMRVTITNDIGYSKLYISKVAIKGRYISVVINDYASETALGTFSKLVSTDYDTINLTPYLSTVSGILTIGKLENLAQFQGAYHFTRADTELEESVLFLYPPTGVIKLVNDAISSVGKITLLGSNTKITVVDNDLSVDVIDSTRVLAHNVLAGRYNNCPTPAITKINTVTPDSNGNIDIYTILPMTIEVSGNNLALTPNLTINQVCPELNKIYPPTNTSDTYYADIAVEKTPEWKTWPYFS